MPAVSSLVIEDRLEHLDFVIHKVREAKLARCSPFAIGTINVAHKHYVLLEHASDPAEVDSFMQPLLDLAVHGPSRSNLANKKHIVRAENFGDFGNSIKSTWRFPRPIPVVMLAVQRIPFSGEDTTNVNTDARLIARGLRLLSDSNARGYWVVSPGVPPALLRRLLRRFIV